MPKMTPIPQGFIQIEEELPCQFCLGGLFTVAKNYGTGECVVLHTTPLCEAFTSKKPDDYLMEVQAKLVGGSGDAESN